MCSYMTTQNIKAFFYSSDRIRERHINPTYDSLCSAAATTVWLLLSKIKEKPLFFLTNIFGLFTITYIQTI